ncbi:MAG TPA: adenylate/guanylate cyclase domain-containing protein [Humisphaera sp.]|jgi:adenylate cyclase|nr:adenylate/guanylate cyclase domain-containing protein [Humisphaera sp.]
MVHVRRFAASSRVRKPLLAGLIALVASGAALALLQTEFVRSLNEPIYDHLFGVRPRRALSEASVVIVAANEVSVKRMALGERKWAWPWPRQFWGMAAHYVQQCGAKAVAIDLLFSEPSQYDDELGDDATLAVMLDSMKRPVIVAELVGEDGSPGRFVPPVQRPPIIGAVNLPDGASVREYQPTIEGRPSLALQVVRAVGAIAPPWADEPFRLHFYGPHADKNGRTTYPYVSAVDVFEASTDPEHPEKHSIDPAIFKDKIVLFGVTAAAGYDLKTAPTDRIFPGVELQATAIENLIANQRVQQVPRGLMAGITALVACLAAGAATWPRRTSLKLLASSFIAVLLCAAVVILFRLPHIIWLPPAAPLIATGLSMVMALSWSYFAEDRQSRFFLRALGQYVSPQVASALKSDPRKLAISTEKGELTILFSDIADFSQLSETLDEGIGPLLNFYMDEMSAPVLAEDGTLDKYIGDAIMCFWNAPVAQEDHAKRACRAALAMRKRLAEIGPKLAELGAPGLASRIGINTGICAYGNMGSRWKFNYSVIGDACNFASRLEGANKIYGTGILIGEATERKVREQFVLRKIDLLRVKGKNRPSPVYELMAEGKADEKTLAMIRCYEAALAHYAAERWDEAEGKLLELLTAAPEDVPAKVLLERIGAFRIDPPPAGWNGVFVAREK